MNRIISLFLFIFIASCLNGQYNSPIKNKVTLGKQTTADGLVFRGNAADTVAETLKITKTNKSDTSAYLLLDTINNVFLKYNIGTTYWTRLNILPTDTASMLGNYWRSGRFSGVLPVANGGTNNTSYISGAIPFSNGTTLTSDTSKLFYDATNLRLGLGTNNTTLPFTIFNSNSAMLFQTPSTGLGGQKGFYVGHTGDVSYIYNYQNYPIQIATNNTPRMQILGNGDVGIGTASPQAGYRLHVVDSVYVGGRVSAAGYTTRSDYNLKDEIQSINYGLNEVMQMQPVKYTYKSNGEQQLGFIAQDIGTLIPESVHFDSFMGVDYQSIIPILTKAIQEQQALIKALEQRIINLENK